MKRFSALTYARRFGLTTILLLSCFVALGAVSSLAQLGPFGTVDDNGKTFTIEGKAVASSIHTCNFKYDNGLPGFCNGSLRVERMLDGKIDQREIIVTAMVAIEKDGKKPATLDSFIGGWVKVDYVQKDGLFIATSVVARTKAN